MNFKNYLMSEREGAETFEYVLIVSLTVAIIVVVFTIVGPAIKNKMKEIADNISKSGASIAGV